MAEEPRVNEQPIYVPSLGQAFGPGGWDYDKNEPTGDGKVYEPGEWEAEQRQLAEDHAEAAVERQAEQDERLAAELADEERPTRRRRSKKAEQTETTPAEEA